MGKPKPHGKAWIVSTHVLTTGFSMPLLAGIAAFGIMSFLDLSPTLDYVIMLVLYTIGYIGGTYYSLSYLRKGTITSDWTGCTAPSIIAFAALALIGLLINVLRFPESTPAMLGLALFYVLITVLFAFITASGFRRLQENVGRAGESVA